MPRPCPHLTTCTACGCTCDDLVLTAGAGRVTAAERACALGSEWFLQTPHFAAEATIDGRPVVLAEAMEQAAVLLSGTRHPLVAGFRHATTGAIRCGVELADRLGACVDWTSCPADLAPTRAFQTVGTVQATWGEVAQRADLVLLWGSDLAQTHPRHFERYSREPASRWLLAGAADRTLIVIDDRSTATAVLADQAFRLAEGSDFEAFTILRAILAGLALDADKVVGSTGVAVEVWQQLADRLRQAHYGTVIYGNRLAAWGPEGLAALTELVGQVNAVGGRCVALSEGGAGNYAGASNVLTWQTGYPLGVSLAQGYPVYGPEEWTTARLLERGEVDLVVSVADDLPKLAEGEMPATIALDWRDSPTMRQARVAIRTARPGVEVAGTTYRGDGVPLPMYQVGQREVPSNEEVLRGMTARVHHHTST